MPPAPLDGVVVATATPLNGDLTIDGGRLVAHCRRLLEQGCGINLLGTTGEATSFARDQRLHAMNAVALAGLPLERIMVGTGAAALDDAVALTAAARDLGFAGALLLPPFYYKGIDPDSLVAYVETLMARVGRAGLRLYLYNFPQLSGVPYAAEAAMRLRRDNPEQVLGLKDSSGDLDYAAALARALPGFAVFPGAEGALARAGEFGFAGCISATANVTGGLAARGWRSRGTAEGAKAIRQAVALRDALARFPLVAAVKWALADLAADAGWNRLMPPLRPLRADEVAALRAGLAGTAYGELERQPSVGPA